MFSGMGYSWAVDILALFGVLICIVAIIRFVVCMSDNDFAVKGPSKIEVIRAKPASNKVKMPTLDIRKYSELKGRKKKPKAKPKAITGGGTKSKKSVLGPGSKKATLTSKGTRKIKVTG